MPTPTVGRPGRRQAGKPGSDPELMASTARHRRYFLAMLLSAAALVLLLIFPRALRPAPFFPAAAVALISLLVLGVGPAILVQVTMLLATVIVLVAPGSVLADPQAPFGNRLALTLVLFALVDLIGWRLERNRRATARRERALWESETRYRHLLEQASDGIVVGLADGRLTLVNQRICEMLGYNEAELLALPITALYAEGELEPAPLAWDELERSSVVLRERQLRRKDGSRFLAELSVRRTADGFAQAIVRDITERRRAEEAMRAEHALLESILATSVAGIMVVTTEGKVVFLNPAAEALLGLTRDQLADRTELPEGWRILTLEGAPMPVPEWPARRVVRTGVPVLDARLIIERPDDECRILSVNAAPFRDPAQRITSVVLSLADITEQQLAQRAIAEREEQFERITSAVPGVVYQYVVGPGAACRFAFMSERVLDLFGVSAGEILADPSRWWAMVDPEDHAAVTQGFRGAGELREPRSLDFRVRGPEGQVRWLRDIATATAARDPERIIWNGVIVDITDRRRLEEELLQSQKMESLGRLAGGVAHDFNNLLTVIRGYADVLSGELSAEDPRLSEVREIRRAADRATSLTRQLLAMSRRQVLVPREVDLSALVQEMGRMLRRVIGEDITIVTDSGTPPGWVRADPGQLEQVLLNLAVNARDAMPGGGTLTIATTRMLLAPGRDEAATRGVPAGDYIVLRVEDSGVGMDRKTQSKIFEPFFTTKPVGEGTGLGLSTVYGIVQQSGGALTVESEPGKGTSFRVFLPRVAQRGAGASDVGPAQPAAAPGERRSMILLVEDDDGVRQLTARILAQFGYDVMLAQDGMEALQLLSDGLRGVDAVVSDVVMPGMSGAELVGRLRARWPDLPVLYLSGYTGEEVTGELGPGSRQAFLQKPFSPDALAAALEELLADTRPPATAG
jgi:two-component system, cell cycle sensor histidine kinase and response regulator CckA